LQAAVKPLYHLNKYFYKYRWRLLTGVFFVAISNIFGIIPAQLIRYALDESAGQIEYYKLISEFSTSDVFHKAISFNLLIFVLLVLLMALLKGVFMFLMRQTIIVVSRFIEYDLKNEIFNHYQQLDFSFYNVNNTGDLMNRISEDVSRVRMYTGPAIMYTVNLVVMFILVIWAMASVNIRLTIYTLLPLPVLSFIIYYVHEIINRKSEQVQEKLSGLSTFVQESFSGIRVLKAFARESNTVNEFGKMSNDYKVLSMSLVKVNALFYPTLLILVGLSTIITVYIGGLEVISGEITIGNIAEFIIYVNMLTWPVASLGWVVSLVQRASASQQRINEFLETKPEIVSGNRVTENFRGAIEFRNVSYAYPGTGIQALENVSFSIEPGRSLAITGRTGSGKSTIANLLFRLIDPEKGSVLVDGINVKEIDLNELRTRSGYVPQEVFLFSDTIGNNISFGAVDLKDEKIKRDKLIQSAKDAAIYDSILEFPDRFNTMVGERGITLSGGQKQRISLARAIIKDPVILVLDDCLSAVDTRTEEEILSNLERIMKNRTTIIISHRISSVRSADHILVLDKGQIVEQGAHAELVQKGGVYADLHEKQSLEEEII
jgi:ATP-binding cassette, subfamily B, multidrug efflux pump